MAPLPKSPTYYQLLEAYMIALSRHKSREHYSEDAQQSEWSRSVTGSTMKSDQEISIIDQDLFLALEVDEFKMVGKIISELKMNNALWYYKRENSRQYKVIKKLVDKKILVHTEDPDIYVVNPFFIRRGTELSVLAHTVQVLSTSSRVHKDHIKELKKGKIDFNGYDRLSLPGAEHA